MVFLLGPSGSGKSTSNNPHLIRFEVLESFRRS
ncbi:hypothetical protein [Collimonas fungivorans]